MPENTHRFITQSDDPVSTDEFKTGGDFGPHERVANAIAAAIQNDPNVRGKMIGLTGPQGGGKSSVVEMLKGNLHSSRGEHLVIYNAWAHQGDPLRRSFLETLIDELQDLRDNDQWLEDKYIEDGMTKWDGVKLDLANRRRVEETLTTPQSTRFGKALAFAALCVPIGMPLLVKGLDLWVAPSPNADTNWSFLFGLAFTMAPLLVLLANSMKIFGKGGWSLFKAESVTRTTTTTLQSSDPTSLEFERYFDDLLSEALLPDSSRHLVIVIDNLDRVDPDVARAIWSTLQTFVSEDGLRNRKWVNQISLIVPFDPKAFDTLWDLPDPDRKAEALTSRSFIEKSFVLRFQVPPPTHSAWRRFLRSCIDKALPDSDTDQRNDVVRVYDLWRCILKLDPTPRELKSLVNQIGTLYLQWPEGPALSSMAYYVLLCRNGTNVIPALRGEVPKVQLPHASIKQHFGESIIEDLSDLAFNVPEGQGRQLLLEEPIGNALFDGNAEVLVELEEKFGEGFWAVLNTVRDTWIADSGALQFANATSAIRKTSWQLPDGRTEARSLVDELAKRLNQIDGVILDNTTTQGCIDLCHLKPNQTVATSVLEYVRRALKVKTDSQDVTALTLCVLDIIRELTSLKLDKAITSPISLNISAEQWIEASNVLASEDPDRCFWKQIQPATQGVGANEIGKALHDGIEKGEFSSTHRTCIDVTTAIMNCHWKGLCAKLQEYLQATTTISTLLLVELIKALLQMRSLNMAHAKSSLIALSTEGHILHWLHQCNSESDAETTVLMLYILCLENPALAEFGAVGNSPEGVKILDALMASSEEGITSAFTKVLRDHNEYALLWRLVDERTSEDVFVREVLKQVCLGPDIGELINPKIILARWQFLLGLLERDGFATILNYSVHHQDLCSYIQQTPQFSVKSSLLYWWILKSLKDIPEDFVDWCTHGIEELTQDEWAQELQASSHVCSMLIWMLSQNNRPKLDQRYTDAIESYGQEVLDGTAKLSINIGEAIGAGMACISDSDTRRQLKRRLLDRVVQHPANKPINDKYFVLFGSEIQSAEVLKLRDDVVSRLFSRLIDQKSAQSLSWLSEALKQDLDLLSYYKDGVDDFKGRVMIALKDEEMSAEVHEILESIAQSIGLEAPKPMDETVKELKPEPQDVESTAEPEESADV